MSTIQETIQSVAQCFKVGVHINWIRLCLKADGHPPQRIESIILWAKQFNEKQ